MSTSLGQQPGHDRATHGSVAQATIEALVALPGLFANSPYALTVEAQRAYGITMHVLECVVTDREWVHTDLEGFTGHTLYEDVSASTRLDW